MDDLLYFQDEAGNEIGLMMIENFEFDGKNYAILATPTDAEDGGIYVMRMDEKDGELAFSMPDDNEMEKVTPFIMQLLEAQGGGCSHDCSCCSGCHGGDEEDEIDAEFPGCSCCED